MGNGYGSPSQGEYGWLVDELQRLQVRLAEVETPTGTSMNSLVAQVQQAIANINTTVNAAISANSYTRPQIDNLVANPPAGSSITGNLSVSGTTTATGDIFTPNATPAVSGYTICYLNSDGRVSKGASSIRFKKFISEITPDSLGNLFPTFKRWQMRSGDGVWRYGYIAEDVAANPDTEPFAIYERTVELDDDGAVIGSHLTRDEDGNPVPESIDFIGLLLAQNAQLHQRLNAAGL